MAIFIGLVVKVTHIFKFDFTWSKNDLHQTQKPLNWTVRQLSVITGSTYSKGPDLSPWQFMWDF